MKIILTSRELHNSSIIPPGRGRPVGLNSGLTSVKGEEKFICSCKSGESIRFSPTISRYNSGQWVDKFRENKGNKIRT